SMTMEVVPGGGDEMTGWWNNAEKQWWHPMAIRLLSKGPMPKHIAFVMDGNRRYARSNALGSVVRGHECGFKQLTKILEWCSEFSVEEVTVYAFSIENFKRSEEEVSGLMRLAEEKFNLLLAESEKLEEGQIRFRFLGDLSLLSPRLRVLIAKITLATKEYTKGTVNVCMPYTSTDEMAKALEKIRQGVQRGLISEDQICEWMISRCLDSGHSSDPDLLIRTSGEKRLSDFLLYQVSTTHLHFSSVMWPEFGFVDLCKALLSYQYYNGDIRKTRDRLDINDPSESEKAKLQPFFDWIEDERSAKLKEWRELEFECE
ncbi:hypothetical protein PENTCL1PPCAC_27320, partial [Pristionchus entomophagus]